MIENNQITVQGTLVTDLKYSHQVFGEKFFEAFIEVKRESGNTDRLKTIISERLIENPFNIDDRIFVYGEVRTRNVIKPVSEDSKVIHKKLEIFIFAKTLDFASGEYDINKVVFNGHIVQRPSYRTTPNGRAIADLLVAVNRGYRKSDYIPCIAWGRNAKYLSKQFVGSEIEMQGRLQSRIYLKEDIEKTAYEVSISSFEIKEEDYYVEEV